jgi:hypothetical protein
MEVPRLDLDSARQVERRRKVWQTDVFVIGEACMSHKVLRSRLRVPMV